MNMSSQSPSSPPQGHQQEEESSSLLEEDSSSPCSLVNLPETLLEEVLSYLFFCERRFVWVTCRWMRSQQWSWERQEENLLQLFNARDVASFHSYRQLQPPLPQLHRRLDFLRALDLQEWCSNDFLYHMDFPRLQTLKFPNSELVTDVGLEFLSLSSCQETLEIIDLTYCRNTTFGGTFPLRDRIPNLKLLRRQPEWLDGRFHTPFGGDQGQQQQHPRQAEEIHTYYPDGSFSFSRDSQSNGFVCDWNYLLHHQDENFVGDKLQYNNFQAPLGWPEWTRYCYRPGVALLNLTPDTPSTQTRYVLVGQRLRGLRPPRDRFLMESVKDQIAVGQSKYYNKYGQELDEEPPEWEHREGVVMISKMKVLPLTTANNNDDMNHPPNLMPPTELVQACRATCEGMANFGQAFLTRREEELHTLLDQDAF